VSTRELLYPPHRSSVIDHHSAATSLTYRVTIAWPTATAHLLVTRSVNEEATVPAPSLISNRPSLRCYLTDVSGYYCVANGHCTLIGNPKCQRGSYRTRFIAHWFVQPSAVSSVHPRAYFGRCGLRLKSFQTNDIELAAVMFRFWLERTRR